MALTRKMLKGMSLTEEQIDTIIEAHTETVEALKDERDKYKSDAQKLPSVQSELDELKANQQDVNPFEQKYNDLKKEYDNYKDEQEKLKVRANIESAYKAMLKEVGVSDKRIGTIMKVTNLSDFKLDKDGKLKDLDKLKDAVKQEWSDFIVSKSSEGADTSTPPDNSHGGGKTKEEILAIKDTAQRQKAIAENIEKFT